MGEIRRAIRSGAALGVIVALSATSCGHSGSSADGQAPPISVPSVAPPTPPASTAAPTTVDPTRAAIIDGYRAAEDAFNAAAGHNPPEALDPRLEATMTGAELVQVRNRLTLAMLQRQYAVGTAELAPVVTSVDGDTAIISDCSFDHGRVVDARNGQTVSGPDTVRRLRQVTMQLEGGTWKESAEQPVGSGCVPGG